MNSKILTSWFYSTSNRTLVIDDLSLYPNVIDAAQVDVRTQLEFLDNWCQAVLPDSCPLAPVIEILELRLNDLESMLFLNELR